MVERFKDGWPRFRAARLMPDGRLAVAIQRGDEIHIGKVSLNGLHLKTSHVRGTTDAQLVTIGQDFISITPEEYDALTYHQRIPDYKDVPALEQWDGGPAQGL